MRILLWATLILAILVVVPRPSDVDQWTEAERIERALAQSRALREDVMWRVVPPECLVRGDRPSAWVQEWCWRR